MIIAMVTYHTTGIVRCAGMVDVEFSALDPHERQSGLYDIYHVENFLGGSTFGTRV